MDKETTNRMKAEFADRRDGLEPVRLNKYLAQAGMCSRREADRLIEEGKVLVDGKTAQMGQKVLPTQDVRVEGRAAAPEKEMILLAVNKPKGVVCTTEKKWNDLTIDTFLDYPKRVFSVGRLDKDSEGLLLMTNNGELQDEIMRAANFHEKEYVVEVDRPFDKEFLDKMKRGVYLKELGVKTRSCKIKKTGKNEFVITLTQGLNRQIRRMCEELGYHVTSLKRIRIMNIHLGNLPVGKYREVADEEMEELYEILKVKRKDAKCGSGKAKNR
ncbi:MAG: pseudouridine synthase [Eubacteriales bacterium]|nr:pseudouridine synthase [Eubacteriales bacterium]